MTTAIDLTRFTGVEDFREYLNAPWRRDGKLYATNGHIMVEIHDDGRDVPAFDKHPNCLAIFEKHRPCEFVSIPEIAVAVPCNVCEGKGMYYREMCPDCDGEGEFKHGLYEYNCKRCDCEGYFAFAKVPAGEKAMRCVACDGFGEEVSKELGTVVGTLRIANRLLRAASSLPNVQVAMTDNEKPGLFLRFDGGRGFVAPLRD